LTLPRVWQAGPRRLLGGTCPREEYDDEAECVLLTGLPRRLRGAGSLLPPSRRAKPNVPDGCALVPSLVNTVCVLARRHAHGAPVGARPALHKL
jgi:hypothetical protein